MVWFVVFDDSNNNNNNNNNNNYQQSNQVSALEQLLKQLVVTQATLKERNGNKGETFSLEMFIRK